MVDLLASAADTEGIDPIEAVALPLDELHDVLEEHIPMIGGLQSMARARAEMRRVDVWEEKETFAELKRGGRGK